MFCAVAVEFGLEVPRLHPRFPRDAHEGAVGQQGLENPHLEGVVAQGVEVDVDLADSGGPAQGQGGAQGALGPIVPVGGLKMVGPEE